jgi:hypothetical protein
MQVLRDVRTALHSGRCLLIFLLLFSRVPGTIQALREGQLVQPKTEGSVRVIYFGPSLSAQSRYKSKTQIATVPRTLSSAKKDGLPLNPDVLRREVLLPDCEVPRRRTAYVYSLMFPDTAVRYHSPSTYFWALLVRVSVNNGSNTD